jgi:hypoxanthine phosphoribosyltransferase
MRTKKPVIDIIKYYNDMQLLLEKLTDNYDCVICLKRSGWILGVYFSNQKTLPVFTVSEIKSLPVEYTNILIVDDKTFSGKSFKRVINKLPTNIKYKTASLYKEGIFTPDIYVEDLGVISKMWYEKS